MSSTARIGRAASAVLVASAATSRLLIDGYGRAVGALEWTRPNPEAIEDIGSAPAALLLSAGRGTEARANFLDRALR